jgi:sulfite oxidase
MCLLRAQGTRAPGFWLRFLQRPAVPRIAVAIAADSLCELATMSRVSQQTSVSVLNRRGFIKAAGATTAAAIAGSRIVRGADVPSLVAGKDPRLVVHTASPIVLETPAELLGAAQVTPASLLFVRNVQDLAGSATLAPAKLEGWTVELSGLIDRPQTIDAGALRSFPQKKVEMVLQCSGNGRTLFRNAAPVKGSAWGRGGMGNVRFGGVPLSALLNHYRVRVLPEAKYLTAEGRDEPAAGEPDFEHSLPVDEVLKTSFLAQSLNGEPLPYVHGGPLRLVTPGYYGTMHVKWLTRLRFEIRESDHTSQVPNYRTPLEPITPGQPFTATIKNSEPNWRMKLKCVVLAPAAGAQLPAGDVTVGGVAFNDGRTRIREVLVSPDGGRNWQAARVEVSSSPYAWHRWQATLKLAPGKTQIQARAVDAQGRTQPDDGAVAWNPQGYTWNGVEKIDVIVR